MFDVFNEFQPKWIEEVNAVFLNEQITKLSKFGDTRWVEYEARKLGDLAFQLVRSVKFRTEYRFVVVHYRPNCNAAS